MGIKRSDNLKRKFTCSRFFQKMSNELKISPLVAWANFGKYFVRFWKNWEQDNLLLKISDL